MNLVNVALFITVWLIGSLPLAMLLGRIASTGDEQSEVDEVAMAREIKRRRDAQRTGMDVTA